MVKTSRARDKAFGLGSIFEDVVNELRVAATILHRVHEIWLRGRCEHADEITLGHSVTQSMIWECLRALWVGRVE